jgi:hypothetical protein
MPYYIHKRNVISAKDREEARRIFKVSYLQSMNEISRYSPLDDKNAIIPESIAEEVKAYVRQLMAGA